MRNEPKTDGFVSLPTGLGSEDYDKRGPNDTEVRYKPYSERIHNGKGAETNG